jgi:hypothetical protein
VKPPNKLVEFSVELSACLLVIEFVIVCCCPDVKFVSGLKRFCLLSLFSGLSSSAFFGVFC